MKRGFEDLTVRCPHSGWLVNKYAAYACMADDRGTYVRLRQQIGKFVTPDAWPQAYTVDLCDHKFPAQPL